MDNTNYDPSLCRILLQILAIMLSKLMASDRRAHVLFALLAFLFSAIVLTLLVSREWSQISSYSWQFRWERLFLSWLLYQGALLLNALIWADMMRSIGSSLGSARHMRIYGLTQLARRLPGTIWYLVGRGYLYREESQGLRRMAAASGIELATTVLSGIVVGLMFGIHSLVRLLQIPGYTLVGVLGVGFLLLHPRILAKVLDRIGPLNIQPIAYRSILGWLAGHAMVWLLGGLVFYMTAGAIVPLDIELAPFFISAWSLIGVSSFVLLLLPSNLGLTEVGLSLVLNTVLPSAVAVSITLFARIVQYVYQLISVLVLVGGTLMWENARAAGETPCKWSSVYHKKDLSP